MAMRPGPRLAIGSAPWVAGERSAALQIAQSEVEEFAYSARNEIEWLNEHMNDILSENKTSVADLFKTPGKLRGKTPRTVGRPRPPLTDIFSVASNQPAGGLFSPQRLHPSRTPNAKLAHQGISAFKKARGSLGAVKLSPPKTKRSQPAQQPPVAPSLAPDEPVPLADSGYHGSQTQENVQLNLPEPMSRSPDPLEAVQVTDFASTSQQQQPANKEAEPAHLEVLPDQQTPAATTPQRPLPPHPQRVSMDIDIYHEPSPIKSPESPSPVRIVSSRDSPAESPSKHAAPLLEAVQRNTLQDMTASLDGSKSPSDASSPIRPIVRKSSLTFASLPARDPLTSNKSLGGHRVSRSSHLDHVRTSYYNRHTGGKSLGNCAPIDASEENDNMDCNNDVHENEATDKAESSVVTHNKTYTQRLQQQISMLGQSQGSTAARPKSAADMLPPSQQITTAALPQPHAVKQPAPPRQAPEQLTSPKRKPVAPGAFPEDDEEEEEDEEGEPPHAAMGGKSSTPRPGLLTKSFSTEIMDSLLSADEVDQRPVLDRANTVASPSSRHGTAPSLAALGKQSQLSISTPQRGMTSPRANQPTTPSPVKSPLRDYYDSPLKHVKNKLSSILKSSKGLLASSAVISTEGKSSLLSPSPTRHAAQNHIPTDQPMTSATPQLAALQSLYPKLPQPAAQVDSPARPIARKTRASTEREKRENKEREREEKEKEKQAKEARRLADQMGKLEQARQKEREKAHIFSDKQTRNIAADKKYITQKEKAHQQLHQQPQDDGEESSEDEVTPVSSTSPMTSQPTTIPTSPHKSRVFSGAEEDVEHHERKQTPETEMIDAPPTNAEPAVSSPSGSRPATSTTRHGLKRPKKPTKEAVSKPKAAPTVIRVNTTSSQQSHFHPSNSALSANLQETLGSQAPTSQKQLAAKSSQALLQRKTSVQSLKSSQSMAGGRPRALQLAARRKEQEERDAQRRQEAKAELERKRQALQEEERRAEQQRRLETQRQKEEERKQAAAAAAAAQAKKDAQRQAALEKAKQSRTSPAGLRSQRHGGAEMTHPEKTIARPPPRFGSGMHESSRPVNAILASATKKAPKRPGQQDDEDVFRTPLPRTGLTQMGAKETKRIRMSEEPEEDVNVADHQLKGPPIRPSGGFKKDLPTKPSAFMSGYTAAPSQTITRDLFKSSLTCHHTQKPGHPMDMAQYSKSTIPFAANTNPAGPSSSTSFKTPSAKLSSVPRPPKATAKSSPRIPNGDAIELPDIETDDDDDDEDGGSNGMAIAPWADSPDLRYALMQQETVDPSQIFGPPQALNMEEVFSKSKDRWHKFRARTSSANWNGADRLTEEDIRKDLMAREKIRCEGGWSYELSRDMT